MRCYDRIIPKYTAWTTACMTSDTKEITIRCPKGKKKVFLDVKPEFVDTNKMLTSGQVKAMPEIFEQLLWKQPMKKVSKLK